MYQRACTHRLVVQLGVGEAEDVAVERIALLVDRRLAPAAWLVPELRARRDGRVQARHLRGACAHPSSGFCPLPQPPGWCPTCAPGGMGAFRPGTCAAHAHTLC